MQNEPKVAIIILNWNGKRDTLACLASLEKVAYKNVETIVVDNGSTDDSISAIEAAFPKIRLIKSKENLGFAGGNNLGIADALERRPDYLLLLNNDTEVDPQIINAFVCSMKEHPKTGILGAKIYLFDKRDQFDHFGGTWNSKKASFDLIGLRELEDHKSWNDPLLLEYACGCALFVKREVFEKIGLLEPKFFLIWEEADFCFHARRVGFETRFCPDAKLWHKVSASFVGGKPHSTYFWWRNRLLWIERNCTGKEKFFLRFGVLLPEVMHLLKLQIIKQMEWKFLCLTKKAENQPHKWERLIKRQAALAGVKDYLLRHFGNGPAWIYKKNSLQTGKVVINKIGHD